MSTPAPFNKPVLILCSATALAVGCLLMVASAQQAVEPANDQEDHVVVGKVTEVGKDRFVVADRAGEERSYTMTNQAKVTLDGRQSGVAALKPGTRVRVTSLDSDRRLVTRVEAIENQLAFGSELIRDGRLASLAEDRLTLTDRTGYPHEFTLAEGAACTIDGETCVPGDLRNDMTLRLTSSRETPMIVERIEALHQHTSFAGGNRVEGTVKGFVDRKLMITDVAGYERTYYVSGPAIVSTDGQPTHPESLEAGTRVMVYVRPDAPVSATHVEAIRNHAIFGVQTVHEGRVVDITDGRLTMISDDGNTHTHTILNRARCMRDGEPCELVDIRPDDRIRVAVKWGDHQVVTGIEALDQHTEFSTLGPAASGTFVAPTVQSSPVHVLPTQSPAQGPVIVP